MIAASVVGLSGATAWADTFTPGIEEQTLDFGLPGGAGNDLTGSSPLGNGNQSSATRTNGKTYGSYGPRYDDESMYGSMEDHQDNGY